jgi:ProP effector
LAKRKSRKATRDEIIQARVLLVAMFPKTFTPARDDKHPIKIGIDKDLLERARSAAPGISRRIINAFLQEYTGGVRYLRNMIAGAGRIDLDGNVCDHVTKEQAAVAAAALKRRQTWIDSRTKRSKA